MTYDVIKRLNLDESVAMTKLLFLERKESGGYGVAFLPETLSKHGDGQDPMSFFQRSPGQGPGDHLFLRPNQPQLR